VIELVRKKPPRERGLFSRSQVVVFELVGEQKKEDGDGELHEVQQDEPERWYQDLDPAYLATEIDKDRCLKGYDHEQQHFEVRQPQAREVIESVRKKPPRERGLFSRSQVVVFELVGEQEEEDGDGELHEVQQDEPERWYQDLDPAYLATEIDEDRCLKGYDHEQ